MKNGLLVWNIVLTLLTGYLLFNQFNKKKTTTVKTDASASTPAKAPFRVAYFEMDSIENNFEMVKDVNAEIRRKEEEYSNELNGLDQTMRQREQGYQQKAATMTQEDVERARVDLGQLAESLKKRKQGLDQQYQDFVMRKQLALKKSIEDYLLEYNKSKEYSYIVAYEPGLFYYKDTAYNVTADVVKGLNDFYKNKKD